MVAPRIAVCDVLGSGLQLYRDCFPDLLRVALPWVALSEALHSCSLYVSWWTTPVFWLAGVASGAFASVRAAKLFLATTRGTASRSLAVSGTSFFFFLVVTAYIQVAAFVGGLFLLLPALLLFASAIFAPILVIDKGRGPFESIGDSVDWTRGNVWRICVLLMLIWAPIVMVDGIVNLLTSSGGIVFLVAHFLGEVVLTLAGLVLYAVTIVLYNAHRSSLSLQETRDETARP